MGEEGKKLGGDPARGRLYMSGLYSNHRVWRPCRSSEPALKLVGVLQWRSALIGPASGMPFGTSSKGTTVSQVARQKWGADRNAVGFAGANRFDHSTGFALRHVQYSTFNARP